NGSVDGFILSVAQETQVKNEVAHFERTISQGLPIVMFDRVAHDVLCDKVIVDDFDAVYTAAKTLLREGRKNIGFISNIDDLSVGKLRERGYNKAILENSDQRPLVLRISKMEDSQLKIRDFFDNNPIDGVIAADYASGIIAINTAISLGLKVP